MTVNYLDKIKPVSKFDPEGNGYDYQNAIDSGNRPDPNNGHWGSLDPRTGMVLKGRNHPTWNLMVEEEQRLGNTVVRSDDGRYYSVKLPDYLGKIKLNRDASMSEVAQDDFNYSLEKDIPLGFLDAFKRDWATGSGIQKKIPFYGGVVGIKENSEMAMAANRLLKSGGSEEWYTEHNKEIDKEILKDAESAGMDREDIMSTPQYLFRTSPSDQLRSRFYSSESDKKLISDYIEYISRDKTFLFKLEQGVSVLPTWMAEFAMTGGLEKIGNKAAQAAGEKMLKSYAKTKAGKLALKTAGWAAGGATRSFGLATNIGEGYTKQMVDEVLGMKEESGWATKLARAWGDVYIEALSESAGEGLTKVAGWAIDKLPFGKPFTDGLQKAWIAATGGTKGEFIRKMASKGGYSNILGEIGEERLGTVLRALTDVDDFGAGADANVLERLQAGVINDFQNIFVEIGVLSVPTGAQYIGGRIINREKIDRIRKEVEGKEAQVAEKQSFVQEMQSQIENEIATLENEMRVNHEAAALEAEMPTQPQGDTATGGEAEAAQIEPQADTEQVVTVYHGKYTNTKTGKGFGGVHVGTKAASEQRLADIFESNRSRVGPVSAKEILGEPDIEERKLDTTKIYRADSPMSEQSGEYKILEDKTSPQRKSLEEQGFKGVAYINVKEDSGSTSYLVWDDSAFISSPQFTQTKPTGKSVLFSEMEQPQKTENTVTVKEGMPDSILDRGVKKANQSRKDQYIWQDAQGKWHITQTAPEAFRAKRIRPELTAAEKRARKKAEVEANENMPKKRRTALLKKFKGIITSSPEYNSVVDGYETIRQSVLGHFGRKYQFGANQQDVLDYIEGKPYLWRYVAKEGEDGIPWDTAAQEIAGQPGMKGEQISDPRLFIELIDSVVQNNVEDGGLSRAGLESFIRSSDENALVAVIYDMLSEQNGASQEDVVEEIGRLFTDLNLEGDPAIIIDKFLSGELFDGSNQATAQGMESREEGSVSPESAENTQEDTGEEETGEIKEDDDFSDVFSDFMEEETPGTQSFLERNLTPEENAELENLEKQLADKLKNQLNVGLDPETFILATKVGGYYVKAGFRGFSQWAAKVRERIGNISDYALRTVYANLRNEYSDLDTDKQIDIQINGVERQTITTTIKDANYSDEIDNAIAQIVTDRANPAVTSARQRDVQSDRESLGLDVIPSPERKGWQQSLQEAKDEGYVDDALHIASEINSNPRPLNDTETAGLVTRLAQLKNKHAAVQQKIKNATEPTAIQILNTMLDRIESEFESISSALHKSGTEKGRALVSQKLTINQDYDLVSVVTRAKAKRGKEITQEQRQKFEKLTSDLEQAQRDIKRLQDEIAEITAKNFMKHGAGRYKTMARSQVIAERGVLVSQIQQLLSEGC